MIVYLVYAEGDRGEANRIHGIAANVDAAMRLADTAPGTAPGHVAEWKTDREGRMERYAYGEFQVIEPWEVITS